MGKYRFKFSDMMPNAWFYKLKDMGKSRSTMANSRVTKTINQTATITSTTTTKSQHPNKSYMFTDPLYSSPRNYARISNGLCSSSPCRKTRRTTIYKQKSHNSDQPIYYSLSSSELDSPEFSSKPYEQQGNRVEFEAELSMFDELGSWSSSSCRVSSSTADIIIDLNHHNDHRDSISRKFQKLNEFDAASELELRPILTKVPAESCHNKTDSYESTSKNARKLKKSRKSSSLSDSFAIVKSSLDPCRDFKDSMMEMIMENNIKGFKDLEELLACYLSLNCKEYHPVIVDAFEQIWLDIFCSTC
ncbi:transcription repressor OFP1-like [Amaranthus tricolor]|uniref:transcription repressor OFP1-like n=1 Tax=Amaranthus tricolor TaxID=29722 RepID=UPI002588D8E2|nr:transcription repressor OFP1-like [Amaranthus tricolor]